MQLSEAACWYLDEYWRAPLEEKGKRCRTATQITFFAKKQRVKVTRRVKVRGKWTTRTWWVTRTTAAPRCLSARTASHRYIASLLATTELRLDP